MLKTLTIAVIIGYLTLSPAVKCTEVLNSSPQTVTLQMLDICHSHADYDSADMPLLLPLTATLLPDVQFGSLDITPFASQDTLFVSLNEHPPQV